ncbi:hypothetical protein EIN_478470 [Entamoeba invadens IP1]|uniref:Uncharacterized protein n=1 Tax=Entamoeba invadens IP1 TaxID=370355 RepID=A0A0A1U9B5_ENTIV|nr:hypothetical protein EIN_478470 [Entamoeba invadens IP1]ELP88585.1 hypothetical protein EIN_478470 [Entamoeba invadens IP1]|eukprot:XP_004255356.1 hypothetical protein EIN_478470 [Entamoeba invadens IP1]
MKTQKECVKSDDITVLNDVNYKCKDGQYLDRNNMCQEYDMTSSICFQGKDNRCISKEEVNCVKSNSFGCVQCKERENEEHKKIGERSFGVVYKSTFSGKIVAIKGFLEDKVYPQD